MLNTFRQIKIYNIAIRKKINIESGNSVFELKVILSSALKLFI